MKQRHVFVLGLLVAVGLLLTSIPAGANPRRTNAPRVPDVSVAWTTGTPIPFGGGGATRFDGEFIPQFNRVYFLGFRAFDNTTDGSIWYYNVATNTYVDTGKDMPIPISNYAVSLLTDSHGIGLWVFGGRDNLGNLVTNTQVYYPSLNRAFNIATDPWPGKTPNNCVSLPAMGVATVGNKAYVMGGVSFSAAPISCVDEQSAQTWAFDPNAAAGSRWTAGPNLNVARGYITTAVANNKIFTIGGDTNVAGTLFASPTVESWTPGPGGWNDVGTADLPVPCDESAAFVNPFGPLANGIVLSTCGQWPNGTGDTYFYKNNVWSLVGAVNETRRNQAGSFIKVGTTFKMYIAGGYAADGATALASTETGVGGPIGSRPGFSRPAPNSGAKATTN
jgi:hypothetical protein